MRRSQRVDRQRSGAVAGEATGSRTIVKAGRNRLKSFLVRLEDRRLLLTFTVTNTLDTVTNSVPTTWPFTVELMV